MDPLTALGIAGNIIQFVEFAGSLVSTAHKIHRSDKGSSPDTLRLEQICQALRSLSGRLQGSVASSSPGTASGPVLSCQHDAADEDAIALRDLSSSCKKDCDKLLNILEKLKVQDGNNSVWKSVKVALKTKTEQKAVAELEDQLMQAERLMSLHAIKIIKDQLSGISDDMSRLRMENRNLHLGHGAKLDAISQGIQELDIDTTEKDKGPAITEDLFSVDNLFSTGDPFRPKRFDKIRLSAEQLGTHKDKLVNLIRTSDDLQREQVILASLDFDARPNRYEKIPQAHSNTFEWIFNTPFKSWLKNEDGIFWLSGKAGCGKSTLMKYIVDHLKTQEALLRWSHPKPVSIASHYFWAAGASIQKSETGLLRTLLYEVFRHCPSCIPNICPGRWGRAFTKRLGLPPGQNSDPWLQSELSEALHAIATRTDIPTRFCFFIDGMDEYNDDHLELCSVLKGLASSRNIKLCVSSRPWNVFQDNFGQDHNGMIRVHDFTRRDIETFARDRLRSHPTWSTRRFQQTKAMENIVRDIRDRAEGVFLWVFLVTRSLRDGLTDGDTMTELKKRLDALPSDLENLFKHMLGQINPLYLENMASMIQIAMYAKEPLKLEVYGYHDREYEDEDYALKMPVKELETSGLLDLYDLTRRRVNARSNGLLECEPGTYTVQFLHRTVSDFMRTGEMLDYIRGNCKAAFDVYFSIFKALVANLKSSSFNRGVLRVEPPGRNTGCLIDELDKAMCYASDVGDASSPAVFDLLDELEFAVEEMFRKEQASFDILETCEPKVVFREGVLRSNLAGYVRRKLKDIPDYTSQFQVSPIIVSVTAENPPVGTLQALLQHGEDPNQTSNLFGQVQMTPWVHLCFTASAWCHTAVGSQSLRDALDSGLFVLFLSHGADPNSSLSDSDFTTFAMYLMTVFCDPGYIVKADEYLRVLEVFLDHGGDLSCELCLAPSFYQSQGISRCSRWWPDQGVTTSILHGFRRGLRNWGETPGRRQTNGRFLSEVVRTLISHPSTAQNCVNQLRGDLTSVFGEHIANPILQLADGDTGTFLAAPKKTNKRTMDDESCVTLSQECRSGKRCRQSSDHFDSC